MKNLLLLLFITSLFYSCETVEINNPGFQANLEGVFFKANDSKGIKRNESNYTIQGITNNEILTLKINSPQVGTYILGDNTSNFATFENSEGQIYSTNGGSGEINITRRNTGLQYFNGDFHFTAISPGLDTLIVNRGVFFEVPYDYNTNNDDDIPNNTELLIAQVNNIPFNPFNIDVVIEEEETIVITGTSTNKLLKLKIPINSIMGTYNLPEPGFSASYRVNDQTESGNSGFIRVIENDTNLRSIKGVFSFETNSNTITSGQFIVTY